MQRDVVEQVRRQIYDSFAGDGRLPAKDVLADRVGIGETEFDDALTSLATARHIALDGEGNITMAHPFTTRNLGFSVMGRERLWWGGCAWDSFAIPHLVPDEPTVVVATTCPACDRALAWTVSRSEPPEGDEVAHFLVPMRDVWNDVVFTCSQQRLYCGEACVADWLSRTGRPDGYVLDLPTLWRLARGWYAGRLDSPYRRRDPEDAKEYFRSVGLDGPFWGLGD